MKTIAENANDFADLRTLDGGNGICVDKTNCFRLLLTTVCVACAAMSFAAEGRCEPNGVAADSFNIRDPYVLTFPEEGLYRLYEARPWQGGEGVDVRVSRDLKTWSQPKPALRLPERLKEGVYAYWAPEVHVFRGKYYLFVTLTYPHNRRGTWIFRSDLPDGPFEPIADGAVTPADWMCLDGTLWVEDGKPYVVFCHEWIQVGVGRMMLAPLKDDLSGLAGEPQELFKATDYTAAAPALDAKRRHLDRVTDGPFLHRSPKSGKLFMIWSNVVTGNGYVDIVCESSSGKVAGPWGKHRFLFDRDGGHGMLFRTLDGKLMLTLHQPNNAPMERMRFFPVVDDGETLRLAEPTVVEMHPGETMLELRDRVRALPPETRAKGVRVVVPPGRHAFADAFVLDVRDSGTREAPVVWCAKDPADRPVFVSGVELKREAFKAVTDPALVARLDASARGKVLEAELAPYGFTMPIGPDIRWEVWGPMKVPDVFVNGRRVPLANYPSEGWCEIEEIVDKGTVTGDFSVKRARELGMIGTNEVVRGGTFKYREDRPSAWKNPVLIECFWAFDWRATIIWTKAIDPVAKTMTMKHHHQYGIKYGNPRPRRWRALNVFEELNAPGRYAIDPVRRRLYLYPPSEPFESVLVCGKPGGTVKFDGAHDIVFSGLDFGASWGYGAELVGARRVTIEKARFRDQRDWAVFGTNVWDCTLRTCDVTQVGDGCFCLWGGDRRKLVPGNNLVEDCLFENWGTLRSSCGYAIKFHGVGNSALHNEIRNANGYVVRYDQNNGVFAYNVVSNTTWGVDDAGAFYKGLNPSMRGNRLEYNYWRDIGAPGGHGSCAIYFDDGDSGDSVFGNVFENCGKAGVHYTGFGAVFSHAGCSNIVRNCIFVKCDRSLGGGPWKQEKWATAIRGKNPIKWKNYDYKFREEIDYLAPEWRKAYPELETFLDPYPEEIRKNAAYDCVAVDCPERLDYPQKSGAVYHKPGYVGGHWHTNETFVALKGDPGFADYANRDYRLKPDSEVYRRLPNFKPIPFEKIGLLNRR